jgi:hypothetical protein
MKNAMSTTQLGKVTIYYVGEFGMGVRKIEAKEVTICVGPFAQYASAIEVTFKAPRQRRSRYFRQTSHPSILVLDGWGHPDPEAIFKAPEPGHTPGVTVATAKFTAFDPAWRRNFDRVIGSYIELTGAVVVADYRKHNPYAPLQGAA